MATWQDILASDQWKGLQPEQKKTVADNYFKTRIEASPEFGELEPEKQQAVRANFTQSYMPSFDLPMQDVQDTGFHSFRAKSDIAPLSPIQDIIPSALNSAMRGLEQMPGQLFGTAMQVPEAMWNQVAPAMQGKSAMSDAAVRMQTGLEPSPAPKILQDMSATGRDIYQGHTAQAEADFPRVPTQIKDNELGRFIDPVWIGNNLPESSAQTVGAVGATMAGVPEIGTLMYGLGEGGGAYWEIKQKALTAGVDPATAERMAQDAMLKTGVVNAMVGSGGVEQVAEGITAPSLGQLGKSMATEGLGEAIEQNTPGFVADSPQLPFQIDPQETLTAGVLGAMSAGAMEGPSVASHMAGQIPTKPSLPGLISQADQVVFSLAAEVKKNKPELWAAFEKEVSPRVANGPLTAELRDRFIAFAAAHSVPATQQVQKPTVRVNSTVAESDNSLQNLNTVTNQPLYQAEPGLAQDYANAKTRYENYKNLVERSRQRFESRFSGEDWNLSDEDKFTKAKREARLGELEQKLAEAKADYETLAAKVQAGESNVLYQSSPRLKVSKLEDNYLRPLSTYSDTLYREASPESAISLIANNVAEDMRGQELFFSNNPNLAKGQGNNKGLLLEFSAGDLQGQVNTSKPTWDFSFSNGDAEFIGKYNSQEQYKNSLVSVTVPAGLKMQKRDAGLLRIALKSWNKVENSDGSVTYNKPSVLYQKGGENNGQQETVQETGAQDAYAAQANGQDAQGQEKEGLLKPRVRIQPTMMKVQPKAPAQILFEQIRKAAPHIPEEQAKGFAFGVFDEFATSKAAEQGISKEEWYKKNVAGFTNREPGKGLSQEGEAPTFYSQLNKTIEERMGKAMLPSQVRALIGRHDGENWISSTGIKKDEVEETGIFDWLDELPQDQKVTKEAVQQWLDGNGVQVVEHSLNSIASPDVIKAKEDYDNAYKTYMQASDEFAKWYEPIENKRDIDPEEYNKRAEPAISLGNSLDIARKNYENLKKADDERISREKPRHTQYTLEGPREGDVEFVMTSPQAEEWNASDSMHYNDLEVPPTEKDNNNQKELEALGLEYESVYQQYQNTPREDRVTRRQLQEKMDDLNSRMNKKPEVVQKKGRTIAWIRGNWRTDATGAKVFHIEEVQSQRHQKGHKEGYRLTQAEKDRIKTQHSKAYFKLVNEYKDLETKRYQVDSDTSEFQQLTEQMEKLSSEMDRLNAKLKKELTERYTAVGNAPFKNSDKWMELVFKRALRYAAENGAEKITYTTGEQQLDRWNKPMEHIKKLSYVKLNDDRYTVIVYTENGSEVQRFTTEPGSIDDYIGDLAANQILNDEGEVDGDVKSLHYPEGLKIGAGLKRIYDNLFTQVVNKYIRKLDKQAKVEWEGAVLPAAAPLKTRSGRSIDFINEQIRDLYQRDQSDPEVREAIQDLVAERDSALLNIGKRADSRVHSLTLTPALRDAVAGKSQALYQTKKGAISQDAIGRAVFHLFKAADFSTLIHESFHFFRRQLSKEEQKILEDWAGVKDGVWTVEAEEKVARAGERYIRDGKAPAPRLKRMYEKFKQWMVAIYQTIRGSDLKFKFNPEVKAIFDKHLGDNELKTQAMVERVMDAGVLTYDQLNAIERFVREVQDSQYNKRKRGSTDVVPDEYVEQQKNELYKKNGYEAEKRRIVDSVRSGRVAIDEEGVDAVIAYDVASREGWKALNSGEKGDIKQAMAVANAFHDRNSWIGRNLRLAWGTSLQNRVEKGRGFIGIQMMSFPEKDRNRLGKIREMIRKGTATWEQYDNERKKIESRHIRLIEVMKEGLQRVGIDINNLSDEQVTDQDVLWQIRYEAEKAKGNWWSAFTELGINSLMMSKPMHVVNAVSTGANAGFDLTAGRWFEAAFNLILRDPNLAQFSELIPMYKAAFFPEPDILNPDGSVKEKGRPAAYKFAFQQAGKTFLNGRNMLEDEVLGAEEHAEHAMGYRKHFTGALLGRYIKREYVDYQVIDKKTGEVLKEFKTEAEAKKSATARQDRENKKKANAMANRFEVKENKETHGKLPDNKATRMLEKTFDKVGDAFRYSPRLAMTSDAFFGAFYARMQVVAEAHRIAKDRTDQFLKGLDSNGKPAGRIGESDYKLMKALVKHLGTSDRNKLIEDQIRGSVRFTGSDAWKAAMKEETRVTFHRPPKDITKAFLRLAEVPVIDQFVIFVNIGVQLVKTGVELTPGVGAPYALYKGAQATWLTHENAPEAASARREALRLVSDQGVGFMALALLFTVAPLFAPGEDDPAFITGSTDILPKGADNSEAGKDDYLNLTQGKAYQINIPKRIPVLGGKSFDYRSFMPFSFEFAVMADMFNDLYRSQEPDQFKKLSNLYRHVYANISNGMFLRTIFEMLNASESLEGAMDFFRNASWQRAIPTFLRQQKEAANPYVVDMRTWGSGKEGEKLKEDVVNYKARLKANDILYPKVDLFGRDVRKLQLDPTGEKGSLLGFAAAASKHEANQWLKPILGQQMPALNSVENRIWVMVRDFNLKQTDKALKWFPQAPEPYISKGTVATGKAERYTLNREQYHDMQVREGEVFRALCLKAIRDKKLAVGNPRLTDIMILKTLRSAADTVARSEMKAKIIKSDPAGWTQTYTEAALEAKKAMEERVNYLQNLKAVDVR